MASWCHKPILANIYPTSLRVLTQNTRIGAAFGLSSEVLPNRIVGQTEDPVDDVRVEFSDDSRLFLQCKRSVSLSQNPASEFGKTWRQFCQQVNRAKGSAPPIRCVLCYEAPNGALSKLHEVFRRARHDSEYTKLVTYARTKAEKDAARVLHRLHARLLAKDRSLPKLADLVSVVHFHRLEIGDASDASVQSTEALQNGILSNLRETMLAVKTLDTLGEELTTTRGLGFDITAIRIRLRNAGIHLKDIPEIEPDMRELDAESKRTLEAFHAYHRDQLGERFTLNRPIVDEVATRAANGSLLVVGEPGAGKTGVLMTVAHKLKASGHRVWFLSVDGYEAKSLPSLEKELNLHHRVTVILGFAAEDGNTVLMLDGLDAARDRVKQSTWRALVREACRRGVPVIATIRLFDLRHSQPWQELFPLAPSESESNVSGLNKVRFTNVSELSDAELNQGLSEFPKVRGLAESQLTIRSLATNIFNFSLLCQLAEGGMPHNPVHTQLELLDAWWNKRVAEAGGSQIEETLSILVERMVSARKLQTSVGSLQTKCVDDAQSVGLIRGVPSRAGYVPDNSVEFTHNVLFDYAAFRCFLLPKRDELISELSTPESWGLFLRPSLGHFFTWFWDKFRDEFWQRAFAFQSASVPTLHKTALWFAIARSAHHRDDFVPFLDGIRTAGSAREIWLSLARGVNGCADAAVWRQLFRRSDGLWWVEYSCDLLRSGDRFVTGLGWQILYVLFYEIEHFKPEAYHLINEAARLEVETHWPIAVPYGPGIKASIWLFCRTISGNPEASAKLIRRMLTPEELAISGYFRGNQAADEIVPIARCLPDLAVEVYEQLYSYREMSAEQVPMGDSVVMAMHTSRHDMYGSCYHALEKGLIAIFGFSPHTATRAVCRALRGEQETSQRDESTVRFQFNNTEIKTSDLTVYSEHLEQKFSERSRLLATWCDGLRGLAKSTDASEQWQGVIEALVQEANTPDMWAALLTVVPEQPGLFQGAIWPMLHSRDLLSCWRFRKYVEPCVEALAKTADHTVLKTWQEVVLAIANNDLSKHNYQGNDDALEKLKSSYLLQLPETALTEASRQFLAQCKEKNVRQCCPSHPRELTSDEYLKTERQRKGLNTKSPLQLQLEKDLASLTPPDPEKVGPSILKRIGEIESRFSEASEELQSSLRAGFQSGFAWALRELAQSTARLTDKQLQKMLGLCGGLLDTSAGRANALEAIALTLSKKRKLTKKYRELLGRVAKRPEPEIVENFGYYVWAFLKPWPEFVWACLERWIRRMGEDKIAESLHHTLHDSWFWQLFHADKQRALKLLERMFHTAQRFNRAELAAGFLAWFAALAIRENEAQSRKLVEIALSKPEVHGVETAQVVRVLVEWQIPRDPRSAPTANETERVSALTYLFFDSAHKALQQLRQEQRAMPPNQKPKEPVPWIKSLADELDQFATEIRYSAQNHVNSLASKPQEDVRKVGDDWWRRAEPLFTQLEKWLHPHFGDCLIDALADWFPHYPARCLHWLRRLCEAGKQTNLLFERIVVGNVIKLLQRCLAEHRDLLNSDKIFLQDFAAVLEALLSTANAEALGMAASLDEFYR